MGKRITAAALSFATAGTLAAGCIGAGQASATTSTGVSNAQAVSAYLADRPTALKAAAGDSYRLTATTTSPDGTSHYRYTRSYQGIPVLGGDFVVHARAGKVTGRTVTQSAPVTVSTTPKVAATASRQKAITGAGNYNVSAATSSALVIDATAGTPRLAWRTVVTGVQADGVAPSRSQVLVDARSGAVRSHTETVPTLIQPGVARAAMKKSGAKLPKLTAANKLTAKSAVPQLSWSSVTPKTTAARKKAAASAVSGTGKTSFNGSVSLSLTSSGSGYDLIDSTRGDASTCDADNTGSTYSGTGDSCTQATSSSTTVGTGSDSSRLTEAADAHYAGAEAWDYYESTFDRSGIFDDGKGVASHVHFGTEGWENAAWNGTSMVYGDGGSKGSMAAVDVAGHEMTHGVTESLADLGYSGDVGGINESSSDVFGTMVEFKANSSVDTPDFEIGEVLDFNGDGSPLRYMDDPAKDGSSLSCWSSATSDEDPHYTSGVGNHAFFLLANGSGTSEYGDSPTCDDSTVDGIGADAASKIWYNAIRDYGTSAMTYSDLRSAMIDSADALYGSGSTESEAVAAAWSAVSVS